MNPSLVPGGCRACHEGHGASQSPMLPAAQREVCLACHGSRARLDRQVRDGAVSATARPARLDSAFAKPYVHPVDGAAFSRDEAGLVVCTSCHSPHRGARDTPASAAPIGRKRRSPRDPDRYEYELCERCHGHGGRDAQSIDDISRLLAPGNPSYHPVEAPAQDSSDTVLPYLRGGEINCTDCHGNDDPGGPRGPHGSREPYLLRARYATTAGSGDPSTYALCFVCHEQGAVLGLETWEGHGRHILGYRASCATCHDPHGSTRNRALIRFGDERLVAGVSPSLSTGRLEFRSSAPGSGLCYLTCHGRDHAPEGYGAAVPRP